MALTWDLTEIEGHDALCWIETDEKNDDGEPLREMAPLTNAFIWSTIAIGIGHWTSENLAEVYTRLKFLERIDGCLMYRTVDGKREDAPLTPEQVASHRGLRCNVTLEPRRAWLKRQAETLANQCEGEYKRWALTQLAAATGGEA